MRNDAVEDVLDVGGGNFIAYYLPTVNTHWSEQNPPYPNQRLTLLARGERQQRSVEVRVVSCGGEEVGDVEG